MDCRNITEKMIVSGSAGAASFGIGLLCHDYLSPFLCCGNGRHKTGDTAACHEDITFQGFVHFNHIRHITLLSF